MSNKASVICDGCDSDFVPDIQKAKDGEIELSFFRCPVCGKKYLVSITDRELRNEISEYAALEHNNRISRLSEQMQRRMREMRDRNIKRSNELRQKYMERIPDVW